MSLIKAKKLQKSYGSLTVLADVSFVVERGMKAALVGNNGTGKTTLLKIVAGIEEPDSGTSEIASDVKVGYLPQDTSLFGDETVSEYITKETGLNGDKFERQMEVVLTGFGLPEKQLEQKLTSLSSGQKSKVALASILLKGADLLLLDEPTNNLDLPALIWLEDFLMKTDAACIVVSHDRRFLDRVVNKIFEIDWNSRSLTVTGGTYSDYIEMAKKRIARHKEEFLRQQEDIDRLSERVREMKVDSAQGSRFVGTDNDKMARGYMRNKAGVAGRVAKTIEKRIEQMDKVEKPVERDPFEIPLDAETNPGVLDVRLDDVVAGYPKGFQIGPLSLELRYGERVGIMGLNGSGKSTLLKTVTGQLPPLEGKVSLGSGIRVGNMMQEHETLPRDQILVEFMLERTDLRLEDLYAKLTKFSFNEKQIRRLISTLSPGGRARLLLALFSAQSVNMLVLDEPTNHLDLETLEALEETLITYKGTVLLVSHDRYFLEKATLDRVYVLADGAFARISDYTDYIAIAEERAKKLLKLL